jgi:hypothetical protein
VGQPDSLASFPRIPLRRPFVSLYVKGKEITKNAITDWIVAEILVVTEGAILSIYLKTNESA